MGARHDDWEVEGFHSRKTDRNHHADEYDGSAAGVVGFVVQDVIDARQDLDEDLITIGQLIGANSNAALTFGDHKTAQEVLSALRTKPSFIAGCIYTDRDVPFATYSSGTVATLPRLPRAADGIVRRDGRVELFRPITRDGERVGTLYIASDLRDLHVRMKEDAQFMAVIRVLLHTHVR